MANQNNNSSNQNANPFRDPNLDLLGRARRKVSIPPELRFAEKLRELSDNPEAYDAGAALFFAQQEKAAKEGAARKGESNVASFGAAVMPTYISKEDYAMMNKYAPEGTMQRGTVGYNLSGQDYKYQAAEEQGLLYRSGVALVDLGLSIKGKADQSIGYAGGYIADQVKGLITGDFSPLAATSKYNMLVQQGKLLDNFMEETAGFELLSRRSYDEGKNLWSKMGHQEFWTKDVADGAAFAASSMMIAYATGGALGSGLLGFAGSTTINTLGEAATEGVEVYHQIEKDLKQKQKDGMINPQTGKVYTDEDIHKTASRAYNNVVKGNIGVLLLSNAVEARLMFPGLAKRAAKSGFRAAFKAGGKSAEKVGYLKTAATEIPMQMLTESAEENFQTALADFETKRAFNDTDYLEGTYLPIFGLFKSNQEGETVFKGMQENYQAFAKGFMGNDLNPHEMEGAMAIALGGIIAKGQTVLSLRNNIKQQKEQASKFDKLYADFKANQLAEQQLFFNDLKSIYQQEEVETTDESGKVTKVKRIKRDQNGNAVLNQEGLEQAIFRSQYDKKLAGMLKESLSRNAPEAAKQFAYQMAQQTALVSMAANLYNSSMEQQDIALEEFEAFLQGHIEESKKSGDPDAMVTEEDANQLREDFKIALKQYVNDKNKFVSKGSANMLADMQFTNILSMQAAQLRAVRKAKNNILKSNDENAQSQLEQLDLIEQDLLARQKDLIENKGKLQAAIQQELIDPQQTMMEVMSLQRMYQAETDEKKKAELKDKLDIAQAKLKEYQAIGAGTVTQFAERMDRKVNRSLNMSEKELMNIATTRGAETQSNDAALKLESTSKAISQFKEEDARKPVTPGFSPEAGAAYDVARETLKELVQNNSPVTAELEQALTGIEQQVSTEKNKLEQDITNKQQELNKKNAELLNVQVQQVEASNVDTNALTALGENLDFGGINATSLVAYGQSLSEVTQGALEENKKFLEEFLSDLTALTEQGKSGFDQESLKQRVDSIKNKVEEGNLEEAAQEFESLYMEAMQIADSGVAAVDPRVQQLTEEVKQLTKDVNDLTSAANVMQEEILSPIANIKAKSVKNNQSAVASKVYSPSDNSSFQEAMKVKYDQTMLDKVEVELSNMKRDPEGYENGVGLNRLQLDLEQLRKLRASEKRALGETVDLGEKAYQSEAQRLRNQQIERENKANERRLPVRIIVGAAKAGLAVLKGSYKALNYVLLYDSLLTQRVLNSFANLAASMFSVSARTVKTNAKRIKDALVSTLGKQLKKIPMAIFNYISASIIANAYREVTSFMSEREMTDYLLDATKATNLAEAAARDRLRQYVQILSSVYGKEGALPTSEMLSQESIEEEISELIRLDLETRQAEKRRQLQELEELLDLSYQVQRSAESSKNLPKNHWSKKRALEEQIEKLVNSEVIPMTKERAYQLLSDKNTWSNLTQEFKNAFQAYMTGEFNEEAFEEPNVQEELQALEELPNTPTDEEKALAAQIEEVSEELQPIEEETQQDANVEDLSSPETVATGSSVRTGVLTLDKKKGQQIPMLTYALNKVSELQQISRQNANNRRAKMTAIQKEAYNKELAKIGLTLNEDGTVSVSDQEINQLIIEFFGQEKYTEISNLATSKEADIHGVGAMAYAIFDYLLNKADKTIQDAFSQRLQGIIDSRKKQLDAEKARLENDSQRLRGKQISPAPLANVDKNPYSAPEDFLLFPIKRKDVDAYASDRKASPIYQYLEDKNLTKLENAVRQSEQYTAEEKLFYLDLINLQRKYQALYELQNGVNSRGADFFVAFQQEDKILTEIVNTAGRKEVPNAEQHAVIRELVRAVSSSSTGNGSQHFSYLKGPAGSGKTRIVLNWVVKVLGIKPDKIYSFSHDSLSSKTIASSTGSKEGSLKDFLDADLSNLELVVIDEIAFFKNADILAIRDKVYAENTKRKGKKPLKVIFLGDEGQIKQESMFVLQEVAKFPNMNVVTPLTVTYRSDVPSIVELQKLFRRNPSVVEDFFAVANMDLGDSVPEGVKLIGVHTGMNQASLLNALDKVKGSGRTKVIIVGNERQKADYLASPLVQGLANQKTAEGEPLLKVLTYIEAQGQTFQEVFVDIQPDQPNGFGRKYDSTEEYNTAMYVATSRAKDYVFLVSKKGENVTDKNLAVDTAKMEQELTEAFENFAIAMGNQAPVVEAVYGAKLVKPKGKSKAEVTTAELTEVTTAEEAKAEEVTVAPTEVTNPTEIVTEEPIIYTALPEPTQEGTTVFALSAPQSSEVKGFGTYIPSSLSEGQRAALEQQLGNKPLVLPAGIELPDGRKTEASPVIIAKVDGRLVYLGQQQTNGQFSDVWSVIGYVTAQEMEQYPYLKDAAKEADKRIDVTEGVVLTFKTDKTNNQVVLSAQQGITYDSTTGRATVSLADAKSTPIVAQAIVMDFQPVFYEYSSEKPMDRGKTFIDGVLALVRKAFFGPTTYVTTSATVKVLSKADLKNPDVARHFRNGTKAVAGIPYLLIEMKGEGGKGAIYQHVRLTPRPVTREDFETGGIYQQLGEFHKAVQQFNVEMPDGLKYGSKHINNLVKKIARASFVIVNGEVTFDPNKVMSYADYQANYEKYTKDFGESRMLTEEEFNKVNAFAQQVVPLIYGVENKAPLEKEAPKDITDEEKDAIKEELLDTLGTKVAKERLSDYDLQYSADDETWTLVRLDTDKTTPIIVRGPAIVANKGKASLQWNALARANKAFPFRRSAHTSTKGGSKVAFKGGKALLSDAVNNETKREYLRDMLKDLLAKTEGVSATVVDELLAAYNIANNYRALLAFVSFFEPQPNGEYILRPKDYTDIENKIKNKEVVTEQEKEFLAKRTERINELKSSLENLVQNPVTQEELDMLLGNTAFDPETGQSTYTDSNGKAHYLQVELNKTAIDKLGENPVANQEELGKVMGSKLVNVRGTHVAIEIEGQSPAGAEVKPKPAVAAAPIVSPTVGVEQAAPAQAEEVVATPTNVIGDDVIASLKEKLPGSNNNSSLTSALKLMGAETLIDYIKAVAEQGVTQDILDELMSGYEYLLSIANKLNGPLSLEQVKEALVLSLLNIAKEINKNGVEDFNTFQTNEAERLKEDVENRISEARESLTALEETQENAEQIEALNNQIEYLEETLRTLTDLYLFHAKEFGLPTVMSAEQAAALSERAHIEVTYEGITLVQVQHLNDPASKMTIVVVPDNIKTKTQWQSFKEAVEKEANQLGIPVRLDKLYGGSDKFSTSRQEVIVTSTADGGLHIRNDKDWATKLLSDKDISTLVAMTPSEREEALKDYPTDEKEKVTIAVAAANKQALKEQVKDTEAKKATLVKEAQEKADTTDIQKLGEQLNGKSRTDFDALIQAGRFEEAKELYVNTVVDEQLTTEEKSAINQANSSANVGSKESIEEALRAKAVKALEGKTHEELTKEGAFDANIASIVFKGSRLTGFTYILKYKSNDVEVYVKMTVSKKREVSIESSTEKEYNNVETNSRTFTSDIAINPQTDAKLSEQEAVRLAKYFVPNLSPARSWLNILSFGLLGKKARAEELALRFVTQAQMMALTGNKTLPGFFQDGVIYLLKNDDGTVYERVLRHELMHKVFHEFLTPAEQQALLQSIRTNYPETRQMNVVQIEEWMAEKWVAFAQGKPSIISKLKYFFTNLRSIFRTLQGSVKDMTTLFEFVQYGRLATRHQKNDLIAQQLRRNYTSIVDTYGSVETFIYATKMIRNYFYQEVLNTTRPVTWEEAYSGLLENIESSLASLTSDITESEEVLKEAQGIISPSKEEIADIEELLAYISFQKKRKSQLEILAKKNKQGKYAIVNMTMDFVFPNWHYRKQGKKNAESFLGELTEASEHDTVADDLQAYLSNTVDLQGVIEEAENKDSESNLSNSVKLFLSTIYDSAKGTFISGRVAYFKMLQLMEGLTFDDSDRENFITRFGEAVAKASGITFTELRKIGNAGDATKMGGPARALYFALARLYAQATLEGRTTNVLSGQDVERESAYGHVKVISPNEVYVLMPIYNEETGQTRFNLDLIRNFRNLQQSELESLASRPMATGVKKITREAMNKAYREYTAKQLEARGMTKEQAAKEVKNLELSTEEFLRRAGGLYSLLITDEMIEGFNKLNPDRTTPLTRETMTDFNKEAMRLQFVAYQAQNILRELGTQFTSQREKVLMVMEITNEYGIKKYKYVPAGAASQRISYKAMILQTLSDMFSPTFTGNETKEEMQKLHKQALEKGQGELRNALTTVVNNKTLYGHITGNLAYNEEDSIVLLEAFFKALGFNLTGTDVPKSNAKDLLVDTIYLVRRLINHEDQQGINSLVGSIVNTSNQDNEVSDLEDGMDTAFYTFEDYIDQEASVVIRIAKALEENSDQARSMSVTDSAGNRVFLFHLSSQAEDLLRGFAKWSSTLIKGATGGFKALRIPSVLRTSRMARNVFVSGLNKIIDLVEHDGTKFTETGKNITFKGESFRDYMHRAIGGSFFQMIAQSRSKALQYIQWPYTISNKPRNKGAKINVLKPSELREGFKQALEQHALRNGELREHDGNFGKNFQEFTGMEVLEEALTFVLGPVEFSNLKKKATENGVSVLVEAGIFAVEIEPQGKKAPIKNAVVKDQAKLDKILDKVDELLTEQSKVFAERLINNAMELPADTITAVRKMLAEGYLDVSLYQKLYPEMFTDGKLNIEKLFGEAKSGNDLRATKMQKIGDRKVKTSLLSPTAMHILIDAAYKNNYLNSYMLNQLVAGDPIYFKNALDIIKRMSGVFGPGLKGIVNSLFGMPEKFTVAVVADSSVNKESGSIENFLIPLIAGDKTITSREQLSEAQKSTLDNLLSKFGNKYDPADGQGFVLPRRADQFRRGFGDAYSVGRIFKGAHYELREVVMSDGTVEYIPTMMKYSSVELTDELVGQYPFLKKLRKQMEKANDGKGVDEIIFASGMKVGKPKTLVNAEALFGDGDAISTASIVTLSNHNYRLQSNPYHETDEKGKGVAHPTQITYFLNVLNKRIKVLGRDSQALVYAHLAKLFKMGMEEFNDEIRNSDGSISKDKFITLLKSLASGPGNERLLQMLSEGVSFNAPLIVNKLFASVMSHVASMTVGQRYRGEKLVLQTSYGFQEEVTLLDGSKTTKPFLTYYTTEDNRLVAEAVVPSGILPKELEARIRKGENVYMSNADLMGFRIPSTEIHSGVVIRVKGFYDSKGSNAIVMPEQLVPLHGSDFDVDSLFVLSRNFWNKKFVGVLKEQGSLSDMFDENTPLGYTKNSKGEYVLTQESVSDVHSVLKTARQNILDTISILERELDSDNLTAEETTEKKNQLAQAKKDLVSFSRLARVTIKELSKNIIMEAMIETLQSPLNRERMLSPISMEFFNGDDSSSIFSKIKAWNKARRAAKEKRTLTKAEEKEEEKLQKSPKLSSFEGNYEVYKSNMEGSALTGIFANIAKALAYAVNAGPKGRPATFSKPFTIAGVQYSSFAEKMKGDTLLVWEVLDGAVNAAIDNVKEQILPIINANSFTANLYGVMWGAGVPLDVSVKFLSSPMVRAVNPNMPSGPQLQSLRSFFEGVLNQKVKPNNKSTSLSQKSIDIVYNMTDNFEAIIASGSDKNAEFTEAQAFAAIEVIDTIMHLEVMGKDLTDFTSALAVLQSNPSDMASMRRVEDTWKRIAAVIVDSEEEALKAKKEEEKEDDSKLSSKTKKAIQEAEESVPEIEEQVEEITDEQEEEEEFDEDEVDTSDYIEEEFDEEEADSIDEMQPDKKSSGFIQVGKGFSFQLVNLFNNSPHIFQAWKNFMQLGRIVRSIFLKHNDKIAELTDLVAKTLKKSKVVIGKSSYEHAEKIKDEFIKYLVTAIPSLSGLGEGVAYNAVSAKNTKYTLTGHQAWSQVFLQGLLAYKSRMNAKQVPFNKFLATLAVGKSNKSLLHYSTFPGNGLKYEDILELEQAFLELGQYDGIAKDGTPIPIKEIDGVKQLVNGYSRLQHDFAVYALVNFGLEFGSTNFGAILPPTLIKEYVAQGIEILRQKMESGTLHNFIDAFELQLALKYGNKTQGIMGLKPEAQTIDGMKYYGGSVQYRGKTIYYDSVYDVAKAKEDGAKVSNNLPKFVGGGSNVMVLVFTETNSEGKIIKAYYQSIGRKPSQAMAGKRAYFTQEQDNFEGRNGIKFDPTRLHLTHTNEPGKEVEQVEAPLTQIPKVGETISVGHLSDGTRAQMQYMVVTAVAKEKSQKQGFSRPTYTVNVRPATQEEVNASIESAKQNAPSNFAVVAKAITKKVAKFLATLTTDINLDLKSNHKKNGARAADMINDFFAANPNHPLAKLSHELFKQFPEVFKDLSVVLYEQESNVAGSWNGKQPNVININTAILDNNGMWQTLIHEAMHAATARLLQTYFTNPSALSKEQRQAIKELIDLFETSKEALSKRVTDAGFTPGKGGVGYGLKNVHEFVAEAFSNPEFMELLAGFKVKGTKTLWQRFKEAIAKLFSGSGLQEDNLLLQTQAVVFNVLEAGRANKSSLVEINEEFNSEKASETASPVEEKDKKETVTPDNIERVKAFQQVIGKNSDYQVGIDEKGEQLSHYENGRGTKLSRVSDDLMGYMSKFINYPKEYVAKRLAAKNTSQAQTLADKVWGTNSPETVLTVPEGGQMTKEEYVLSLEKKFNGGRIKGNILHKFLEAIVFNPFVQDKNPVQLVTDANIMAAELGIRDVESVFGFLEDRVDEDDDNSPRVIDILLGKMGIKIPTKPGDKNADLIATEVLVGSEMLGYMGSVDMIVQHADGVYSLVDWKTGQHFSDAQMDYLFKYGMQFNNLFVNPKNRAKMQLMLYAFMFKLENPDARFRTLSAAHIPNKYLALSYAADQQVEVDDFLGMIEMYYKNERPEEYAAIKAKSPNAFNANHYRTTSAESQKWQTQKNNQPSTELSKMQAQLKYLIQSTLYANDLSEATQKKIAKLTKKIIDFADEHGFAITNWAEEISWGSWKFGSLDDVNHPVIRAFKEAFDEAADKATEKVNRLSREFDALALAVFKERNPLGAAMPVMNTRKFWAFAYTDEQVEDVTIKRLLTEKDEQWKNLTEKEKALLRFVNKTFASFVGPQGVFTRKATGKKENGKWKDISDLDLFNMTKRGQDRFEYMEGFLPAVPMQLGEVAEKSGVLSKSFWKAMWYKNFTMFEEFEYDMITDDQQAIPLKGLGNRAMRANGSHSLDLNNVFNTFMRNAVHKEYMDDVHAFGRGLQIAVRHNSKGSTTADRVDDFLDKIINMQVRRMTDQESDLSKKAFMSPGSASGRAKQVNFVKVLGAFKSSASMAMMSFFNVGKGIKNAGVAAGLTIKEGIVEGTANVLLSEQERIESSDMSMGGLVKALGTEGMAMVQELMDDVMLGTKTSKLKLLMQDLRYDVNAYYIAKRTLEDKLARSRVFSSDMMYILHSLPEQFVSAVILAAQLKSQKIQSGKYKGTSLYDMYDVVEVTTEDGATIQKLQWKPDGVRGYTRKDGVVQPIKELTSAEKGRLRAVYKRIHGGFRQTEKAAIEYYWWGQLAMQFKRHLPTILKQGFAAKAKSSSFGFYTPVVDDKGKIVTMRDETTGEDLPMLEWQQRVTEGHFRTFFNWGLSLVTLGSVGQTSIGKLMGITGPKEYEWKNLSADQKRNIIDGAITLAMFILLTMVAGSYFEDDDEKATERKIAEFIFDNMSQQWNIRDIFKNVTTLTDSVALNRSYKSYEALINVIFGLLAQQGISFGDKKRYLKEDGSLQYWNELQKGIPGLASWYANKKALEDMSDN